MTTIDKHEMRSILGYLDQAMVAIAIRDASESHPIESNAAWNLRMARTRFLDAAIGPVGVEIAHAEFARTHGIFALADCLANDNAEAEAA